MFEKIVITGGSGFLGKALSKRFPKAGLIIADVREPEPKFKDNYVYTDVTDSFSVYEACKGAKEIYHLASNPFVPVGEKNPLYDVRLNIHGTINTINAAIKNNARMIFTSSMMVGKEESNYQISKWACEQYIQYYVHKKGLNAVMVRLENLYGPNQRLGWVIPDFIYKLQIDSKILEVRGSGYAVRGFLYIDDAIDAMLTVMKKGKIGEVYPVTSGRKFTINALGLAIGTIMNNSPPILCPQRILVTPPNVNLVSDDCSKTKALGWKPKFTLKKGLRKCIDAAR